MKASAHAFALLGGPRTFASDLPVGQLYFPTWEHYKEAMGGIIERRYYTNHGPLVQELESRLEDFLGVANVVTVSNATIGLYLVALALEITGRVIMPAFTFVATAQAALLANLEPVFCDVDLETHQVTPATAEAALRDEDASVAALCAVNLWGGCTDVVGLEGWAQAHQLPLYFDSAHGFGSSRSEGRLGRFGQAEVFSFHATKIMSATEGGCVATNDDHLAERIRNMRSNYGIRHPVTIPLTINARMSEAQAAVALISLDELEHRISHNTALAGAYRSTLQDLPGVLLHEPPGVTICNHQSMVIIVDEQDFGLSPDLLWTLLRAEGVRARRYFSPGVHRSVPFGTRFPRFLDRLPVTDQLCRTVLQLPVGALVGVDDASRIGEIIRDAHACAEELRTSRR